MVPIEIGPQEARQFSLLVKRAGADPTTFKLRKLADPAGKGFKVRVAGRGAATVYDTAESQAWLPMFNADVERGLFGTEGTPLPPAAMAKALFDAESSLAQGGLSGLLDFLNTRVVHRFTALYRLDGPVLRNVAVHDKHKHLDALDLKVVPLKDSFCQFVLRDGLFLTPGSGEDERLKGHPYSGIVGSYVGVPVSTQGGALRGTLCHFDLVDHEVSDDEFLFLERAAGLLPLYLQSGPV